METTGRCRGVLRRRQDLRNEYAVVKLALAADPGTYIARRSGVQQEVLAESGLTHAGRREILEPDQPPT